MNAAPTGAALRAALLAGDGVLAAPADAVVLPNGLTLLVRRVRSAPAVAIVTYVKAGYFDESDDIVGIAHVLEHMYFKGTPTRGVGAIARETKATGGYLNAHTIYDHTSYYTVVPASRFAEALAIQADAYINSSIDAGELTKEIEVIIQEVRRKDDSPAAVATETLHAVLFDRHRIRRWRIGRPELLRTFTRDRVLGFYRHFYRPRNTILSIVGDVDPEAVEHTVRAVYGGLPDVPVERLSGPVEAGPLGEARYREWGGDIVQTQLVLGWRTVPALHPDTPLLDLAGMVLGTGRGSRLYRAIRERRLASSATAYGYAPGDVGLFVIHAEGPPERAAEAARAIWAQVDALRHDGVEPHALLRAQRLLEARWVHRSESMEAQASYLAEWQALGAASLGDQYLERALAATPEAVSDAVRRYLAPDALGVVVYRPAGSRPLADSADALLMPTGLRPPALDRLDPAVAADHRVASTRPAALEHEESGVRVYRTATGVPILVRRASGAQMAHMGVYALGGVRDERAENAGVTALMARGALKGARGRSAAQVADAIEMLGGSIGPSVSSDSFGWGASVPLRHTTALLELLADAVLDPTLSDAAIETERALAQVELANLRDDMYRFPMRLATEAAFGAHPYGRSALGTNASLGAVTSDDVRRWHAARVQDAPFVIGVVADADSDALAADVTRVFGSLRYQPAAPFVGPPWPPLSVVRSEQREKEQTAIALAFPGPARGDDDRMAADLIAGVASGLGGRFFEELRDRRSLAYTVQAFATTRAAAGLFFGYIGTSPESESLARSGLQDEFVKLATGGVTAEELRRAQVYALGTHAISRQSGGTLLAEMLDAWLLGHGLVELERYEDEIRAVTPAHVQRVAAQYFQPDRVVEGIVRGRSGS